MDRRESSTERTRVRSMKFVFVKFTENAFGVDYPTPTLSRKRKMNGLEKEKGKKSFMRIFLGKLYVYKSSLVEENNLNKHNHSLNEDSTHVHTCIRITLRRILFPPFKFHGVGTEFFFSLEIFPKFLQLHVIKMKKKS